MPRTKKAQFTVTYNNETTTVTKIKDTFIINNKRYNIVYRIQDIEKQLDTFTQSICGYIVEDSKGKKYRLDIAYRILNPIDYTYDNQLEEVVLFLIEA